MENTSVESNREENQRLDVVKQFLEGSRVAWEDAKRPNADEGVVDLGPDDANKRNIRKNKCTACQQAGHIRTSRSCPLCGNSVCFLFWG